MKKYLTNLFYKKNNIFYKPMIDDNVVKACFSDKKYDITIQTNAMLIVNIYFLLKSR